MNSFFINFKSISTFKRSLSKRNLHFSAKRFQSTNSQSNKETKKQTYNQFDNDRERLYEKIKNLKLIPIESKWNPEEEAFISKEKEFDAKQLWKGLY